MTVFSPNPDDPTGANPDHRVRVARQRRLRMRQRLLDAVLAAHHDSQDGKLPAVEAILDHASVSKATFYKYFASVDEAVGALGSDMVEDMVKSLIAILGDAPPPLFAMTTSVQLFLLRGVLEPQWASFVARGDALGGDTEARRGLTRHLRQAADQGQIDFEDYDAAIALALGSLIEGMHRFSTTSGQDRRQGIECLVVMILMGLGLPRDTARAATKDSADFIYDTALARLPWWRDPWA